MYSYESLMLGKFHAVSPTAQMSSAATNGTLGFKVDSPLKRSAQEDGCVTSGHARKIP